MKTRIALSALLAVSTAIACGQIFAETLLIERVKEENQSAMPARGHTMAQVESRFGAPSARMAPRGGQKRQWPTIHRWVYPTFTVYFENSKVIDAVANQAGPGEIGPKPPIL